MQVLLWGIFHLHRVEIEQLWWQKTFQTPPRYFAQESWKIIFFFFFQSTKRSYQSSMVLYILNQNTGFWSSEAKICFEVRDILFHAWSHGFRGRPVNYTCSLAFYSTHTISGALFAFVPETRRWIPYLKKLLPILTSLKNSQVVSISVGGERMQPQCSSPLFKIGSKNCSCSMTLISDML